MRNKNPRCSSHFEKGRECGIQKFSSLNKVKTFEYHIAEMLKKWMETGFAKMFEEGFKHFGLDTARAQETTLYMWTAPHTCTFVLALVILIVKEPDR